MYHGKQFFSPEDILIDGYERAMRAGAMRQNSFFLGVAQRYRKSIPEGAQRVFLSKYEIDSGEWVEGVKQRMRRWITIGETGNIPADFIDPWLLELPEPYQSESRHAIYTLYGFLAVPIPKSDRALADMAKLLHDQSESVQAMIPIVADNIIDHKDKPHAKKAITALLSLITTATGIIHAIRKHALEETEWSPPKNSFH